jgi:hypothetical protein
MRQPCATSRIQLHDVDLTVRFRKRRWDFLSSELRSSITASNLSTICSQYVSVFACCSRFKLAARPADQIVEQFRSRPMGLFALLRFENHFCIFCIFFIVEALIDLTCESSSSHLFAMRMTWIERSLASQIRVGEITTHHGSIEFNDDWVVERHVLNVNSNGMYSVKLQVSIPM